MPWLKKYNTETTLYFPLIDYGATDFEDTPVTIAAGDAQISKDGGAFANTTNVFAHEGNGVYSLVLTAAEMSAANIVVTIIDQTGTKEWEDQAIIMQTYGNASADMAFDLSTATVTTDTASRTASKADVSNLDAAITTRAPASEYDTAMARITADVATEAKQDVIGATVTAIEVDTGTDIPAQITALNNISVSDILTTQMTESYAADGAAPTLAQSIFLVSQALTEFAIADTTITVKKLDGSTTAATYTIDDDTTPTSRTRAT